MTLLPLGLATAVLAPANTPQLTQQDLAAFDLGAGEFQNIAVPGTLGTGITLDVVLDGTPERLQLVPHSMRSADFQVLVQDESGELKPTEVAAPATFRGSVFGRDNAWASGSLINGQLEALVSLGDGRTFGIQPAETEASGYGYVVYEAGDIIAPPGVCGTPDGAPTERFDLDAGASFSGIADFRVCEIACDADVEFYQSNQSSVDATVADIEKILIAVEAIYGIEVEVLYEIGTIIVRTAEPDPYSSTAPSTLLQQFDSHWSSQQVGVQRDIAHLFTGKNLDGSVIGIARLNAICSQFNGYGLSQSKYTSSFVLRTRLTAHELGHNWSANHCNGAGDCGIMCQGGCGSPTQFGTSSTNSILNEKASSGCLTLLTAAPVLTGVSGDATVWLPEPLEVLGTDLFTATSITVDGVDVGSVFPLDDTAVSFAPPLPSALGDVPVTVTTPLGTSNAINVTYVATDPPQFFAPQLLSPTFTQNWSFAGMPGAAAVVIFSLDNTTVPIEGIDVLFPEVIQSGGILDNLGLGLLPIPIPTLPFLSQVFSQVITIDGPTIKGTEVQTSIVWV